MSKSLNPELLAVISALDIKPTAKSHLLKTLHSLAERPLFTDATVAEIIRLQQDAAGDIVKGTSRQIGNVRFHLRDFLLSAAKAGTGALVSQEEIIASILAALVFLNDVVKSATVNISSEDSTILYTIWAMLDSGVIPTIPRLAIELGPNISELKLAARIQYLIDLGCVKMAGGEIGLNDRIVIRSEPH